MKKFLLSIAMTVFLSVSLVTTVHAIPSLPGPEWKLKFDNLEMFNPDVTPDTVIQVPYVDSTGQVVPGVFTNVDVPGGPFGDGLEDNWGIARVTQIFDGHSNSGDETWSSGKDNYEIFVVFGGLDVTSWDATGFKTKEANFLQDGVTAVDAFFDIYLVDETDLANAGYTNGWQDVWGAGPGKRIGAYGFEGISDIGVLLAAFDFEEGISDPGVLTAGDVDLLNPPTGKGTGYADLDRTTLGLWNNQIEDDFWPTPYGPRDAQLVFNFQTTAGTGTPEETAGWQLSSDDPLEGGGVIPEPGTFFLFGFGLLGIAGFGRRKYNM